MKISEAGKQYVTTREFASRLNDTVELALAKFGPGECAKEAGYTFAALCLAGYGRCGCPTMCKEQLAKFLNAGGRRFRFDHVAEIDQAILGAYITTGLAASA